MPENPPQLWYAAPAATWNAALPIGNGRLGAMVFGRVATETLQLNEDSLWYGSPKDRINPDARVASPQIRNLLLQEKVREAEQLARYAITATPRQQFPYQSLGLLTLEFADHEGKPTHYRRELNLDEAIASVNYTLGETRYERELFSSAPSQVLVCRLTCQGKEGLSFGAFLSRRPFEGDSIRLGRDRVGMTGQVGPEGVRYSAIIGAKHDGGTLRVWGDTLLVENARSVLLVLAANTTYRGIADPIGEGQAQIDAALQQNYEALRAAHVAEYQSYFRRVTFSLGGENFSQLPTDERLQQVGKGADDPQFLTTCFHYGRYLLISSSRPGTLAANLQGIWNESMTPPWECKYTININIQMNYWVAEVCNLARCHEPLFDLLDLARRQGREVANRMYSSRGFCLHTNTTAWGDATPQGPRPSIFAWTMGGAWLATHLWEHYQFGRDEAFLKQRAYPVLKECAEFILDYGQNLPSGHWATGPSGSPENDFLTADGYTAGLDVGVTIDMALARAIFGAVIQASDVLGVDADFRHQLHEVLTSMAPYQIGKHGQLQEWRHDYEEADPGHRHVSHLWPLHPGHEFSVRTTPQLTQAVRTSIERRLANGGGQTGWSAAWIANLFARLEAGDEALNCLLKMLAASTFPNLLVNAHEQVQIDGTFGATAAIAEMLLQSHNNTIHLLPALPKSWRDGHISGLRARGGVTVGCDWQNGRLTEASLQTESGGQHQVQWPSGAVLKQLQIDGKSVAVLSTPGPFQISLPRNTTAHLQFG